MSGTVDSGRAGGPNFVRDLVAEEVREGKHGGRVHTRFPPEPNGYLHIGHAKAVWLNADTAREFEGLFNLRFDDTNPLKEEEEFVRVIQEDIAWLGFGWDDRLYFASDYYETFFDAALVLVRKGLAYVDDLSADEIREYRGTLTEPGRESPHRDRPPGENEDLFLRMRKGEFPDGSRVLRARIDMASPNINMRDPVLYRIVRAHHHRTGDAWCIYPMYDFAHPLSDAIEGITHSLCSLEFEDHRPLYDWVVRETEMEHRPRQIEFAKLLLSHTVLSKRRLRRLVEEGHVSGWDDPRLLTLRGMRRRGYPAEAVVRLCAELGVSKRDSTVEFAYLEHQVREVLNRTSPRYMAVLRPLKVVITNYPEGQTEELEAVNNPEDPGAGTRKVPFSRELYIERDDFMLEPVPKFYRLAPGREVRLRYAYFLTCREAVVDPETGEVTELRCTYDPETRSGSAPDGRKVKATLHWVSAPHAGEAEVRLYGPLFRTSSPGSETGDFLDDLDPGSLEVVSAGRVEPALVGLPPETRVQFERLGYFAVDVESTADRPVFNRTVTLKDAWARIRKGSGGRG